MLDAAGVLAFIDGSVIDLGAGSSIEGVAIATLDDLDWSMLTGVPADLADEEDSDTLADLGPLCADGDRAAWDVGLGSWACAPEEILLERLDTASATSGQVLTYDGLSVSWSDVPAGDACVLQTDDPSAGVALVACGTTSVPLHRWETFQQLASGDTYTCGLTDAGAVRCWGDLICDVGLPPSAGALSVAAGNDHACAIQAGGLATCWGENGAGQATPPGGAFDELCGGAAFSCGRRSGGTIECWGSNSYGKATPPAGTYSAIACGSNTGCAIDGTGSVVCWGSDTNNVASPHSIGPAVSLDLGSNSHGCAVTVSGTIQCWGYNNDGQATPPPDSDFAAVTTGYDHSCGLHLSGTVECWGSGNYGKTTPPPAAFSAVAAGDHHGCGITETGGRALCWGYDGSGQLHSP